MVFHGRTALEGAELMERMGTVHGLARLCLFLELVDLLARTDEYELLSSPDFSPVLDAASLDIIQRTLTYLFQHFAEDLKLPDVAERAGMSESTFSRFFQKNTGNSFSDHLAKLRLWQACKLLADTDVAITDICFQVGYMGDSQRLGRAPVAAAAAVPRRAQRLPEFRFPAKKDLMRGFSDAGTGA